MSKAMDFVNLYIPDVSKRVKLYAVVSDEDIPLIADEMYKWEEKLVRPLQLTPREVSDIHEETNKPKLKRRKVLELWKTKVGVLSTYGLLLEKCLLGGDVSTAETICKLIQQGGQNQALVSAPSQSVLYQSHYQTQGMGQFQPSTGQHPQQHQPNPGQFPPQGLGGQPQGYSGGYQPQGYGGQQGPSGGYQPQGYGVQHGPSGGYQPQEYGIQHGPSGGFQPEGYGGQYQPNAHPSAGQFQMQGTGAQYQPNAGGPQGFGGPPPQTPSDDMELKTLEYCIAPLETALAGPERELVHFLNREYFISDSVCDKVLNPVSQLGEEEKAGELVKGIKKRVKQDRMSFYAFVTELKRYGKKYQPILSTLETEYAKQQGAQGSVAGYARPQANYPGPRVTGYPGPQATGYPGYPEQQHAGVLHDNTRNGFTPQESSLPVAPGTSGQTPHLPISLASAEAGYVPVESDGSGKILQYEAMPRGTHRPKLKLHDNEHVETVINPQPFHQDVPKSGYYKMPSSCHGVAFIINNRTFANTIRHGEREGTERDEYNLLQTCAFLGYRPVIFRNLTSVEILQLFANVDKFLKDSDNGAKKKVAHDSFICCILSHGDRGVVFGSDSEPVKMEDIEKATGKSKTLRDRPKIFFIQACQGTEFGTEAVLTVKSDGESTSERAHIYTCKASVIGDKAYRYTTKGSWFVIEVCRILCEFGTCYKFPDDFQPHLNANVANNKEYRYHDHKKQYVQQPVGSNQLQHCIHFFSN